eukprot:62343-Amphidinium_carterae.2
MENGFGETVIQVDNKLAILQLAQEAARKLTIPWIHSSSHSPHGQNPFHKTWFAQCRASRFDWVDRYNLQSPDNVSEALLPYVLQYACFTINRYVVHADGMTNYQRRWSLQCNGAICSFGEIVLADIKPITINKLAIGNNEQKIEGIWLGKTTNSGEHTIATKENNG